MPCRYCSTSSHLNVYIVMMQTEQQQFFFILKKTSCVIFYFLIMLIHVQSIGIYMSIDNRTSEWKAQSKLFISWEHLGVLKIDWNDQKLKQFLWIVYCNTHSLLDKSNLNHYENWKKKLFPYPLWLLLWMWWIPISMVSFFFVHFFCN